MNMVGEKILVLLFCHFVGDYVLQSDFLARTKGTNWWHLLAHSTLYILPFYACFGASAILFMTWIIHFVTDACKARYKMIGYVVDQVIHLLNLLLWLI